MNLKSFKSLVILGLISQNLFSQSQPYISGSVWETCPKSLALCTYTFNEYPSGCKFNWTVENGNIYNSDGSVKIGKQLNASTQTSIKVKWDEEPSYFNNVNGTINDGKYPQGTVTVTTVQCNPSSNDGKNDSKKITIKSIKGYQIPIINLVYSVSETKTTNSQINVTNYEGNVNATLGSLPINYPPNGIGFIKTVYPDQISWSLPLNWTATGYSGTEFINGFSVSMIPPCWGYSTGTTNNLKIKIITPEQCIIDNKLQEGGEFILKVQRDAPYITGLTSNVSGNILWGETKSFTATATTNRPNNGLTFIWNLPNGYTRTSTGSTGEIITTVPSLDITTNGCNFTDKISIKVQKCNQQSAINTLNLSYKLPSLTGPLFVCNNTSYLVTDVLSSITFNWTCSTNISKVSSPGSNPFYFNPNGTGNGSIQVVANSTICGSVTLTKPNLWVGTPQITNQKVDGSIYYSGKQICPGNHWLSVTPVGSDGNPATWTVPSGIVYFVGNNTLDFTFPFSSTSIAISAKAANSCGIGTNYYFYLSKKTYGCTLLSGMTLYPNPASDVLNVIMPDNATPTNLVDSVSTFLAVEEIGDSKYSTLKVNILTSQSTLLNTFNKSGKEFNLPIQNLKNGIYLLEVNDGRNIYRQQFIIKH
ncbi:MAG: hypothetical protein GX431_13725 [Bacteroidales bacterium]|jgi:hypothetical protein|nr:hypothetical protein [Bacteroidales bacterium]